MPSDPLILAFDTSAAHCAAALLWGDQLLGARFVSMGRGQAEQLMPLLQDLLDATGKTWRNLDAVAVGVGPGNFTGIRISVSAARGLALGLNVPAIGVNSFEAITLAPPHIGIPAVPGPRGQAYLAPAGHTPYLAGAEELQDIAQDTPLLTPEPEALAEQIGRVALRKYAAGHHEAPAPLYIKAADAAPPRDPAPRILSDDG